MSKRHRRSTDQTSRTLNKFLRSVARIELGATTARILHWISAGESTVPGIPQVFSISVISFTEMKLRSHSPSVTPSVGVLVRFPLHVILIVEAARASTIVPKTSKNQRIVRCFAIFATQKLRGRRGGIEISNQTCRQASIAAHHARPRRLTVAVALGSISPSASSSRCLTATVRQSTREASSNGLLRKPTAPLLSARRRWFSFG